MRLFSYLLLLTIFTSCNTSQTPEKSFNPKIINCRLPLKLSEIDWENQKYNYQVNDQIETTIKSTIHEYYKENYLSNGLQENCYISTVRLPTEAQTIFLILLRDLTGYTNSKVLFYDNETKEFIPGTFDFNLFALYNNFNGQLKVSNLKEQFKIETPEIQSFDFNGDGIKDFQFTRLVHNGTFNAIKTTIVSIRDMKIDTLTATEKSIEFEPR